jgi:antitoxin VapB
MALSIKNQRAEELAHEVARRSGQTMTQTVIVALEERLQRLAGRGSAPSLLDEIQEIQQRCAALPNRDERSADEILGYAS